jgi:hypothetical protein
MLVRLPVVKITYAWSSNFTKALAIVFSIMWKEEPGSQRGGIVTYLVARVLTKCVHCEG